MFLCKKYKTMEVNEPVVAYGALSDPIEDMQNKVIAAVKELNDMELLQRCYQMLCGVKTPKCGLDLAIDDIKNGRICEAKDVDDLFRQILD
jgi:hypothetical protein